MAYCYGSDLAQGQYILIDFMCVAFERSSCLPDRFFAPVMFFIVKSRAVRRLKGNPPASNVFGPTTLSSILGSLVVVITTWYLLLWGVEKQRWYARHKGEPSAEKPDSKVFTSSLYELFLFA
jgi:hypothetical protein